MTAPLPFGNIYAPQWMGVWPGVAGFEDREFDLDLPMTTVDAASQTAPQALAVDDDADFLIREIEFALQPVIADGGTQIGPLDLRIRIRDGNGRLFTSDFVPIVDLTGPVLPVWPVERGAVLYIEYQNISVTTPGTVQLVLKGIKRKACPGRPAPVASAYVPMARRYSAGFQGREPESFAYPFNFTSAGTSAFDLLRIPIQTDNDADFLWRGLTGDWEIATNDTDPVGLAWLTFWDPHNRPLTKIGLTVPWGSQNAGMPRENTLSNSGGRLAAQFPEIFIPRGGVVELTVSFGTSTAAIEVIGMLRGMKLYDSKGPR
jgi:hypothetical protein